ncbi:hypothetical protein [Roseibium sp.]|uniref:hypothetical protein n=1 Tax=Roseibium sp. TaxID=1936156 RepID=UPI003A986227
MEPGFSVVPADAPVPRTASLEAPCAAVPVFAPTPVVLAPGFGVELALEAAELEVPALDELELENASLGFGEAPAVDLMSAGLDDPTPDAVSFAADALGSAGLDAPAFGSTFSGLRSIVTGRLAPLAAPPGAEVCGPALPVAALFAEGDEGAEGLLPEVSLSDAILVSPHLQTVGPPSHRRYYTHPPGKR